MPEKIARQQLKKKMLDRWENEGGRIGADSTIAHEGTRARNRQNEGNRRPTSLDNVRVRTTPTPSKKRKKQK